MKKGLPAVIIFNKESTWVSCQTITRNLVKAYQELWGEDGFNIFYMSDELSDHWLLADQIKSSDPSCIIYLDHYPHPYELILAIDERYGEEELPPFVFHVYGDFTLYPWQWMKVNEVLKKTAVKFICASPKQVSLVSKFVSGGTSTVDRCPFPTDVEYFKFIPELRKKWRDANGIKENEIVVSYSGRLSLQKNVDQMIHKLISLKYQTGFPIKVFVAGPFDDIAAPYFGCHFEKGFYFKRFMDQLGELPENEKSCVTYVGNLNRDELREFLHGADVFASLSMYHDEDYGMAPAEALCCGTPVVLSDWGGYGSFGGNAKDCKLVPVNIGHEMLEVNNEAFSKAIIAASMFDHDSVEERTERSKRASDRVSVRSAAKLLNEIYEKEIPIFSGFTWRMSKLAEVSKFGTPFPEGPKAGTFYEEIYESYAQQT